MKKLILLLFSFFSLMSSAQIPMSQVSGLIPKLNSKQDSIQRGTGFLKRVGLIWSYDPSTYLTTETDPVFNSSVAKKITASDTTRWNTQPFAGVTTKPSYTDNGNGTVTISSGNYTLNSAIDGSGYFKNYTISGGTFTLTDGVTNYIYADYNSGNPTIKNATTLTGINDLTTTPIFTLNRIGNYIGFLDWDSQGLGLANKLTMRLRQTERFTIVPGGLTIGEATTRRITIGSGTVWYGATYVSVPASDSGDGATQSKLFVYNGTSWSYSLQTQYNNTQYQGASGLTALGNNKYGIVWVYKGVESDQDQYCVMGTASYNQLANAQAATIPTNLPSIIPIHTLLCGRIIFLNGASSATQIDNYLVTGGTSAGISDHSKLSNLVWGASGHTGTNNTLAAFDGSGNSTNIATSTYYPSTNPSGYISSYSETDPVFISSQAHNITSTDITHLSNLSGTNTGDETSTTIKSKLGITTLSGSNTGDNAANSLYSGLVSNATHTGDVTGSTILTLANVNSNIGTYNNVTINAKGLATAGSNVSYLTVITSGQVTTALGYTPWYSGNHPTTLSTYGITDAIQNQNSLAQVANMWISNYPKFGDGSLSGGKLINYAYNGSGILLNNSQTSNGNVRNFSIQSDNVTYGDLSIKVSSAQGVAPDIDLLRFGFDRSANFYNILNSGQHNIQTINNINTGLRVGYSSGVGANFLYNNSGNTTTSFTSEYASNSALMNFVMQTAGTPVTSLSIYGSGVVSIPSTTPSTSPTTGALVVGGGIGAGGNVVASGFKTPTGTSSQFLKADGSVDGTTYKPNFTENTAFNKNFGSSSGTVCQGNDSRLSDSRIASDVYSWAKASTKPTYTYSEVGAQQPITLTTTGTSGAATFSGGVLNVPNYGSNVTGGIYTPSTSVVSNISALSSSNSMYTSINGIYTASIRISLTNTSNSCSFIVQLPSTATTTNIVGTFNSLSYNAPLCSVSYYTSTYALVTLLLPATANYSPIDMSITYK